jgi:cell division protein FtsN
VTQDFASNKRSPGKKAAPQRSRKQQSSAPWAWFFTGLLCGIFLSALVWLAAQQPDVIALAQNTASATTDDESTGPRFDFYTLLPEQRVDVEVDAEAIAKARSRPNEQFLLQAGSFKQADDADRRRAELILLGLEAHVEETSGDNGRWYRVYIGPFASRSRLARARSLTAQQGIDTLLLRRPAPAQG